MSWLKNYVAVVTGAGSGIGKAIVRRYLEEGMLGVGVLVRQDSQAEALRSEFGDAVCVTVGDVRSPAANTECVEKAVEAFGKLDTLVGNAGIWDYCARLEKMDIEKLPSVFDEVLGVNLLGYMLAARAAAPHLRSSKGSMIFTLSNSAFYAGGGGPMYVASKHAGVGLIRQLAYEFAPDVRVNGVAPGGTLTPLHGPQSLGKSERRLSEIPGFEEAEAKRMPLGFAALPEQHTGHYVLLASKENSAATTATVINSDCGWEIRRAS